MRPPLGPVIVELFPGFAIHWYGVLIVGGIVLGAYYAAWQARRDGENPDHVWNGITLAIILAIVGARLYHVFSEPVGAEVGLTRGWSYYRENPIKILFIWEGGLGIYGAVAGGVLGALIYARYAKLRLLQWLDYGAPGLILGQAIGRWGNFFNQELYGPPTNSSWWGLIIDKPNRILPFCTEIGHLGCKAGDPVYPVETTLFHPTFLYESLWCLLVFVVLVLIFHKWRDRLLEGDILWGYVIGYPLGRFFIEHFFRPDAWMLGSLAAAQWFAIVCVVGGTAVLVVRHVLARRAAPTEAVTDEAPEEIADEVSDEITDEISYEISGEVSDEVFDETSEEAPEEEASEGIVEKDVEDAAGAEPEAEAED